MTLLSWIVFGIIIGILARLLDPRRSGDSVTAPMLLGVTGTMVAVYLANIILGIEIDKLTFSSFSISLVGALVLLTISSLTKKV
jgi:uncharacterized membrane protein YeaQ/YmgE (transglycosylase-associated protein family)